MKWDYELPALIYGGFGLVAPHLVVAGRIFPAGPDPIAGRIFPAAPDPTAGRIFPAEFPVGPTARTGPTALRNGLGRFGLVRSGLLVPVHPGPVAFLGLADQIACHPIDSAGLTADSCFHFPWKFPQIWVIGFPPGVKRSEERRVG